MPATPDVYTVPAGGAVHAGIVAGLSLPGYVPAPGDSAVLTVANGGLLNQWRDVTEVPSLGYLGYYGVTIRNDYSGAVYMPDFGAMGALMVISGGHSATNNNGHYAIVVTWSGIEFRRVLNPSDIVTLSGGLAAGDVDRYRVDLHPGGNMLNEWGEFADGRPANPHAWQQQVYLPPSLGGASNGSIIQVLNAATAGYGGNFSAAHRFDYTGTSLGDVTVTRISATANPVPIAWFPAPPLAALDRANMRILLTANGTFSTMRWFDIASGTHVAGTGTPWDTNGADSAGGGDDASAVLVEIPERGLIVEAQRRGGVLTLYPVDVTVAQPSRGAAATLSAAVPLPDAAWSSCCWCPRNGRLIVGGLAGGAVAEIDVPVSIGSTWTVTTVSPPSGGVDTGEAGLAYSNNRGHWHYNDHIRSVMVFPRARRSVDSPNTDAVHLYRPTGT